MSYATKEQLESLMADIASKVHIPTVGIGGGYAPIGTIISYMGTTAPQDYLICDGSVYNIADYSQLANFIEAQFGSKDYFGGNGTTTFGVPDLRGEFLRGTGTNSHTNQGSGGEVGEHQDSTTINPGWAHDAGAGFSRVDYTPSSTYTDFIHIRNRDGKYVVGTRISAIASSSMTANATSSGNEQAYNIRPTNTSVLYCIKAVVAGEVYSTDERVVGTWIDGKPVYRKVCTCNAPNVGSQAQIILTIPNITVVDYCGFVESETGVLRIIPSFDNSGKLLMKMDVAGNGISKTNFNAYCISSLVNKPVTIIVYYTKTTD